jgi:hypothetical protein
MHAMQGPFDGWMDWMGWMDGWMDWMDWVDVSHAYAHPSSIHMHACHCMIIMTSLQAKKKQNKSRALNCW